MFNPILAAEWGASEAPFYVIVVQVNQYSSKDYQSGEFFPTFHCTSDSALFWKKCATGATPGTLFVGMSGIFPPTPALDFLKTY